MPRRTPSSNTLFYGDNLAILRDYIEDESVDLVYLDPPFNSNANYNVLFKAPDGHQSQAQIEAFEDTWHWNESAERAFDEVVGSGNSDAANMLIAMRSFLRENDMMAYLAMMAVRLIELHRVLKPTGSLYLHCDPTASHYLKILLDAVFDPKNFRNEITWKRQSAHSDARHKFSEISDIILFYSKSNRSKFYPVYRNYDEQYVQKFYRHDDGDGRGRYRLGDMASPNPRPNMMYEWRGFSWPQKGWRYQIETMGKLDSEGRIWYPTRSDGSLDTTRRPALKRYLDEQEGSIVTSVWDDIHPLHSAHAERLGYPTQKPVALLERILSASSNEGDLVLDPFCGCGTTVHAAEKLGRRWLGIDVTHLAIGLIRKRLKDAFPEVKFDVVGVPQDADAARELAAADKYQFQFWALSMIDAVPYRGGRKGGDGGVDGYVFFKPDGKTTEKAVVSVKGGASLNPAMVKDLIVTVEQEGAKMGVFLTLAEPTKGMVAQAAAAGFYKTEFGEYPKIQIVTVDRLFEPGNPLKMPWQDTSVFRKAKREETGKQGALDL